jgi:hypothetical protein
MEDTHGLTKAWPVLGRAGNIGSEKWVEEMSAEISHYHKPFI